MTTIKTALALTALAAGVAACGSTAAATPAKPTNTQSVDYNKPGPCNDLPKMLVEPRTTPSTPTATSCWANGLFVGNGPLQGKQIIFASKMADLLHYEATSAIFTNPKEWASWNKEASKYADSKVVTGIGAQMAILLNKNETFALPPSGTPVQNSGLSDTAPSECQSSVVLAKNSPSPQYLVGEQNVAQKGINNGKPETTTGSWTDVIAKFGNNYKMVGLIPSTSQVPPCVG